MVLRHMVQCQEVFDETEGPAHVVCQVLRYSAQLLITVSRKSVKHVFESRLHSAIVPRFGVEMLVD